MTPLASIFGSGFLIIVPVLERALGGLAVVGVAGISAIAWVVGSAIRHNITAIEPLADIGELDTFTVRLERLSDALIVVAYVISVALYLRIGSEYVVAYVAEPSSTATNVLTTTTIAGIVAVGIVHGFHGLSALERYTLAAVLVLTTLLGGTLLVEDLGRAIEGPPVPDRSLLDVGLVLGGALISVQGFETVRYLRHAYDAETRIWASRLAQAIAASIYIGIVAVATPLMTGGENPDRDLLELVERVAPLLALPLVLGAAFSQFSAATADTVAADGNMRSLRPGIGHAMPYLITGGATVALSWSIPTFTIIAIASRAFAAYYCVQCVVAVYTSDSVPKRAGFGVLALLLAAITLFARPVG